MLNNLYRKEIERLDLLILNWATLANCDSRYQKLGVIDIDTECGLCHNASLYDIPMSVLRDGFSTWEGFSGSMLHPVGGVSEYHENKNKFTVERLRLAKHLRTYLFIKGSPKLSNAEKLTVILNKPFVAIPVLTTIVLIFMVLVANSIK